MLDSAVAGGAVGEVTVAGRFSVRLLTRLVMASVWEPCIGLGGTDVEAKPSGDEADEVCFHQRGCWSVVRRCRMFMVGYGKVH